MSAFVDEYMAKLKVKNPNEPEFHQAAMEVAESLEVVIAKNPKYSDHKILERISEPERVIMFRVPWVDEPECVGCNLCQLVCPVPGCITMEEVPNGPPDTWNDRVASGRGKVAGGIHDG